MFKKGFYGGKFMPFHNGHLHCVLTAMSQCEEVYVVLMYNGREELELQKHECKFGLKYLTPHVREMAIRKELNDFPNVHVIAYDCKDANDRAENEGKPLWHYECEDVINMIGEFDAVYSSEPSYGVDFERYYPFATHVVVDAERKETDQVSGTMLRAMGVKEAYPFLPRSYQQVINRSVLFVGTSSCGKSTIIRKLARYFNTSYSLEYGKEQCFKYKQYNGPCRELYDEYVCAQYIENRKAINDANMVALLDTDSLTTLFFCEINNDDDLPSARAIAEVSDYDVVLFFEPTVPFVPDGIRTQREADERWEMNELLKNYILKWYGDKVRVLSGTYEENYRNAISIIKGMVM